MNATGLSLGALRDEKVHNIDSHSMYGTNYRKRKPAVNAFPWSSDKTATGYPFP